MPEGLLRTLIRVAPIIPVDLNWLADVFIFAVVCFVFVVVIRLAFVFVVTLALPVAV